MSQHGSEVTGRAERTFLYPRPEQAAVGGAPSSSTDSAYAEPDCPFGRAAGVRCSGSPVGSASTRAPGPARRRCCATVLMKTTFRRRSARPTSPRGGPGRRDAERHSFAMHLPEAGSDFRPVQEVVDHRDVSTPMIDTCSFAATASSSHWTGYNTTEIKVPLPSSGPGRGQFADAQSTWGRVTERPLARASVPRKTLCVSCLRPTSPGPHSRAQSVFGRFEQVAGPAPADSVPDGDAASGERVESVADDSDGEAGRMSLPVSYGRP
jgi:hypothetical protein